MHKRNMTKVPSKSQRLQEERDPWKEKLEEVMSSITVIRTEVEHAEETEYKQEINNAVACSHVRTSQIQIMSSIELYIHGWLYG